MKHGYDPIGKKETRLAQLTITFYTDTDLPDDDAIDEYCDHANDTIGDVEEYIRLFVVLKNDIRLETEQ